jgi:predicted RNA methylase
MPVAAKPIKRGNTRVTGKEQYYTPKNLAAELTRLTSRFVPDLATRTVIEPAGGTGAFIEAAAALGVKNVISFDIEPLHAAVRQGDFLAANLSVRGAVAISNPPFGRNNSLSIPFFNKAAEYADTIAFIVPRSWRKWSVINRLDRNFALVHDADLKIDYVDSADHPISRKLRLATCFQIWQRQPSTRPLVKVRDMGLVAKVKPAEADVSLTVFGYGCGAVKTEFERVPNTTQMFLKLTHPKALIALRAVDFSRFYRNTAYTEALSLQEVNFLLNEYILGDPQLEEATE